MLSAGSGGAPVKAPSRVAIALTTVGAALAAALGGFIALFSMALGMCGGDGGAPNSARPSLAAKFCHSALYDAWPVVFAMPAVALAVGGIIALVQRSWWPLKWSLAVAFVACALAFAPTLLPNECTDAQRDAGANCETYN